MIKILAIGNSFSQDATVYLHDIASSAGVESKVVNLYIGGCSLERHNQNIDEDAKAYAYELNGNIHTGRMASIMEALCEEEWDFVTMQQASHFSGLPDTYYPFIFNLSEYVKKYAPNAKQVIHQTWAYESTSKHQGFVRYGNDQNMMYPAVIASYEGAAQKLGGLDIIRCGEMIQALRSDEIFDVKTGKYLITRDGYHMNIPYGRYALSGLWFEKLMGGDIAKASFIPGGADAFIINRVKQYIKEFNR